MLFLGRLILLIAMTFSAIGSLTLIFVFLLMCRFQQAAFANLRQKLQRATNLDDIDPLKFIANHTRLSDILLQTCSRWKLPIAFCTAASLLSLINSLWLYVISSTGVLFTEGAVVAL